MVLVDQVSGREVREGDWVVRGDGASYRVVKAYGGLFAATVMLAVGEELVAVRAPLEYGHPLARLFERAALIAAPED